MPLFLFFYPTDLSSRLWGSKSSFVAAEERTSLSTSRPRVADGKAGTWQDWRHLTPIFCRLISEPVYLTGHCICVEGSLFPIGSNIFTVLNSWLIFLLVKVYLVLFQGLCLCDFIHLFPHLALCWNVAKKRERLASIFRKSVIQNNMEKLKYTYIYG